MLQGRVPRPKIADRDSVAERSLVVRGDLRTYQIHLGSGNVLMEPNDRYLYIVPRQSAAADATGRVLPPSEGDGMLSIVPGKTPMLADDREIGDDTITRQFRP